MYEYLFSVHQLWHNGEANYLIDRLMETNRQVCFDVYFWEYEMISSVLVSVTLGTYGYVVTH